MRREILRSSHTRPTAIMPGNPIEAVQMSPMDFPWALQGELRRALTYSGPDKLCLVVDHEAGPDVRFTVETRSEVASWLQGDDLPQLARMVRSAAVGQDELLCLLVHSQGTGLRLLQLADVLEPEAELAPSWANVGCR